MRKKWSRLVAFSLTGLVSMAVASNAHADRRSSLAGNLLIADQDDVYMYPQLTLEHRNLVSFDFFPGPALTDVLGANSGEPNPQPTNNSNINNSTNNINNLPTNNFDSPTANALTGRDESAAGLPNGQTSMGGAGLLLFGQEGFAFGIASHREDNYGATANQFLGVGDLQLYGNGRLSSWGYLGFNGPLPTNVSAGAPLGPAQVAGGAEGQFIQPLQLADVLLGIQLAPQHSFGARLSLGVNTASIDRLGTAREDTDSWSTTAINLVLGYSMRGNISLDLNLELGLSFFSNSYVTDQNTPNYDDSASLAPSFTLSGRSMIPLAENVKLGVLGIVHVNSSSFDNEFGVSPTSPTTALTNSASSSNFFIEAGAGPVYELPDNTTIAAYGTLGFGGSNYDFDSGEVIVSTSALMLPGFKLALEHPVFDWLTFRSGISSRYYFQSQSQEFDNDALDNISLSASYYEFLWSAGLGFNVGNFELNGTLQTPFVTNGPELLGGTGSGLFTLLNASYKF